VKALQTVFLIADRIPAGQEMAVAATN